MNLHTTFQCSRCPREETKPITLEEANRQAKSPTKAPPAVVVQADGKELGRFDLLCDVCAKIVSKYLDAALKKPKHQSSLRERIEIEADDE